MAARTVKNHATRIEMQHKSPLQLVVDNSLDALWRDWMEKRELALRTCRPADVIAQGKAFGALTQAIADADQIQTDSLLSRLNRQEVH